MVSKTWVGMWYTITHLPCVRQFNSYDHKNTDFGCQQFRTHTLSPALILFFFFSNCLRCKPLVGGIFTLFCSVPQILKTKNILWHSNFTSSLLKIALPRLLTVVLFALRTIFKQFIFVCLFCFFLFFFKCGAQSHHLCRGQGSAQYLVRVCWIECDACL